MDKKDLDFLMTHDTYIYAKNVVDGEIESPKYIKIVCQEFLDEVHNEDSKYFIDMQEMKKIINLTKLLNFSTGIKAYTPIHDGLAGFQWFFIINALCWKHKDNPIKRRYEKSVLLIARKSGKTFLIALIFAILLLIEPKFSEFYSAAPDRELSKQVHKELTQMIEVSPHVKKYFELTDKEIRCTLTKSKFTPLAYSENRMDGRHADVFVVDEVGALRSRYPIDALQSSQMNMVNRTGILISTAYESLDNPMVEETDYAKKVLDGIIEDETLFALLYEPNDKENWTTDETILQANPLCYDVPSNFDYLKKQRAQALTMDSAKANFLTKHLNIFVDGTESDGYIDVKILKNGMLEDGFDWVGKEVYLGVDLSQTTDNTSVTMVHYDEMKDEFYAKSWAFWPQDETAEKSKKEKVSYSRYEELGYGFGCGDRVISYAFVEDFVMNLQYNYGVVVKAIGYDRYNAISSVNKWAQKGYTTVDVAQHSSVLHPATKLLKESILKGQFFYDKNELYEINFSNARETKDTNLNIYVNKKKSTGKVDMVVSTINAMYLWSQEIDNGPSVYEDRGIVIL